MNIQRLKTYLTLNFNGVTLSVRIYNFSVYVRKFARDGTTKINNYFIRKKQCLFPS